MLPKDTRIVKSIQKLTKDTQITTAGTGYKNCQNIPRFQPIGTKQEWLVWFVYHVIACQCLQMEINLIAGIKYLFCGVQICINFLVKILSLVKFILIEMNHLIQ